MSIFTTMFWRQSIERAIKTAAQAALLAVGASDTGPANLFQLGVGNLLGFAAAGAVLSVLTSVASAPMGPDPSSPSVV